MGKPAAAAPKQPPQQRNRSAAPKRAPSAHLQELDADVAVRLADAVGTVLGLVGML